MFFDYCAAACNTRNTLPVPSLFNAGGADRLISRGGGADMYPDSGTKGRGHRGTWIKGFSRREGGRRRRTGVRGEGAVIKKSQTE